MFKNIATLLAAGTVLLTAQAVSAGTFGGGYLLKSATLGDSSNIVSAKQCKFYHPDGYTYKDRCPDELQKGSRKKRAGIGAGVGAALGAGIGAIAGGGKGAAIGAGVGAGAGALGGAASVKKCWYFDDQGRQVKVKCNQRR